MLVRYYTNIVIINAGHMVFSDVSTARSTCVPFTLLSAAIEQTLLTAVKRIAEGYLVLID